MLVCTIIDQMRSKIRCDDDDCRNFRRHDYSLRYMKGILDKMDTNTQGEDCTRNMSNETIR